ncbi:MAG: DUF2868 domain-containing protein [Pseudomonadota bacterium]
MLAEAVNIRRWLREDRRTPYARRLERDRRIGRELTARDPSRRILGWWRRIRYAGDAAEVAPDLAGEHALGQRVEAGRRLASAALAALGLLAGAGVAGVVFTYDGRYPVNLFTVIGLLVGLPTLMLLFTLLLLPGRIPGLGALQSLAAGMNLGRWAGAWLDRFLGAELFAPGLLRSGSVSAFSRWQLVVFSQWLALGFFTGALAVAMLLVTFSDLAFGWSTTLDMSPRLVHGWVSILSAPWAPWLGVAAPDLSLVEASRFYRLEEGRMALERVERLGSWWPFVLMTVLVYGALPRLVLLLIGAWRLRRATVSLLRDDPEVTALLDRLETPLVALGGDAEEAPEREHASVPPPEEPLTAEGLLLMVWNGAVTPEQARAWLAGSLGVAPACTVELGILQSADEQRRILAGACAELDQPPQRLVLITKGWEPPLLEFLDFLALVREHLGDEISITVVPLSIAGEAVAREDREVWARALAEARDPRLYVMEAGA